MGDRYPDDAVAAYKEDCQFFDPGYDDRDWGEIAVPACWQAEGHDYNGAAWYRLRFDHRPGAGENVARLSFLGVDYFADVWLNGLLPRLARGLLQSLRVRRVALDQGGREPAGGEGGLAEPHQSEGPPDRQDHRQGRAGRLGLQRPDGESRRHLQPTSACCSAPTSTWAASRRPRWSMWPGGAPACCAGWRRSTPPARSAPSASPPPWSRPTSPAGRPGSSGNWCSLPDLPSWMSGSTCRSRGCGGRGIWASSTSIPWTSASGRVSAPSTG